MDFEVIIYLLVIIGSFVFSIIQNIRKNKNKQAPEPEPSEPVEDPFEAFMQKMQGQEEVEEASGELDDEPYTPLLEEDLKEVIEPMMPEKMRPERKFVEKLEVVELEEEEEVEVSSFKFDAVQAVIYSEILNRKY